MRKYEASSHQPYYNNFKQTDTKKNCVEQPKWNETTKESTKTDATASNYRTIERIHLPIMRKIAQDFPCVRIKTSILKHSLDGFLGNQRLRVKSDNNADQMHSIPIVIKRWKIETAKLVLRCVYFVNGGKYLPLLRQQFGSQGKLDDRESHIWLYLFRFFASFFLYQTPTLLKPMEWYFVCWFDHSLTVLHLLFYVVMV